MEPYTDGCYGSLNPMSNSEFELEMECENIDNTDYVELTGEYYSEMERSDLPCTDIVDTECSEMNIVTQISERSLNSDEEIVEQSTDITQPELHLICNDETKITSDVSTPACEMPIMKIQKLFLPSVTKEQINSTPDDATTENIWYCLTCGHNCETKEILDEHMQSHTVDNLYICTQKTLGRLNPCAINFNNESNKNNAPQTIKTFRALPCDYCGKIFGGKIALEKHIQALHQIKNTTYHMYPPTCGHCEKTFSSIACCRRHVYEKHLGTKRAAFSCPHCSESFCRSYRLSRHIRLRHRHIDSSHSLHKSAIKNTAPFKAHISDTNSHIPLRKAIVLPAAKSSKKTNGKNHITVVMGKPRAKQKKSFNIPAKSGLHVLSLVSARKAKQLESANPCNEPPVSVVQKAMVLSDDKSSKKSTGKKLIQIPKKTLQTKNKRSLIDQASCKPDFISPVFATKTKQLSTVKAYSTPSAPLHVPMHASADQNATTATPGHWPDASPFSRSDRGIVVDFSRELFTRVIVRKQNKIVHIQEFHRPL